MAGQVRTLRRRLRSVGSTKKITKAQELIAASRLGRSQERVAASQPYSRAITGVLAELASTARLVHPLLVPRPEARRAGILLITSDRGLCGGYNANAIRTAEQLVARLSQEGKDAVLYVVGRKGETYYRFRQRALQASWAGFSECPTLDDARRIGETLLATFLEGSQGSEPSGSGVDELYLVHTQFLSSMNQTPVVDVLAPVPIGSRRDGPAGDESSGTHAVYEFEPEPEDLLSELLPKYVIARVYAALVGSAASETASRRRACNSATDNAEEMIKSLTRRMNSARQAEITQEISEIVGGANALAEAGSEV